MNPLFRLLTPNVRATLAVLFTAFIGGFLGALQTQLETGIPPENTWKHVVGGALLLGAVAAWHRVQPSPGQIGGTVSAFILGSACALGLATSACNAGTAATIAQYAPTVIGGACALAADQGSAEPGWEVWVCNILDPSTGKPTGATVELHVPKGTKVASRANR